MSVLSQSLASSVTEREWESSPVPATVFRDLAYVPGGTERQWLDLYLPADKPGPFPILIWVHGGAWQSGSKDNCPLTQQALLQHGFALASINYRLSTEARFPAQLHDCKATVRWLRAHAREFHLDPHWVGVSGASAGGHLAALLGTTGATRQFDTDHFLEQSSEVQAVCDFFGPSDFPAFASLPEHREHGDSPIVNLLGGTVWEKPALAREASPVWWVLENHQEPTQQNGGAKIPPFLIFHGDSDPVVPISQSRLLYDALKSRGIAARLHTVLGAGHGEGFAGPEIGRMVAEFFNSVVAAAEPARTTI